MIEIFLLKELTRTSSIYTTTSIVRFYLKTRSVVDMFHDFLLWLNVIYLVFC
jgi:hypothetical protein